MYNCAAILGQLVHTMHTFYSTIVMALDLRYGFTANIILKNDCIII